MRLLCSELPNLHFTLDLARVNLRTAVAVKVDTLLSKIYL